MGLRVQRRATAALDRGPDRPHLAVDEQEDRMLTRALLCAACALLVSATPAHATFPGQNGKIAFMSFDEVQADIYTMSPNGSRLRNLTNSPVDEDFPRWSADGRMIAIWSTRKSWSNPTGDQEIFVMNADGSGLRQVTFNTVDDG